MGIHLPMAMPPSGLFAVLTALFAAVIIGANIPDGRDLGVLELESEISLLSMHETARSDGDGEEYFKIPNFVFNHMAVELNTQDRMECQRICNERLKCKSYSYREPTSADEEDVKDETQPKDDEEKAEGINDAAKNPPEALGTCAWSTEGLHYSLGWQFYTKAKDVDWKGNPHLTTNNFHKFSGLEYQESSFEAVKGLELKECKQKCAEDPKCGAFSYNEAKYICRLAGLGVHYDTAFSYYEKPITQTDSTMSKVDLDMQSESLATQEAAAKHAAHVNAGIKKVDREKRITAAVFAARAKRRTLERQKKVHHTRIAEKKLLAAKKKESHVKDVLAVQTSFETGYFENRGQAQESKTKEVKLKAMEIVNSEQEQERSEQTKSGEYRAKKQTADFNKKIVLHKIRIAQTKEKLLKLKNKELQESLKAQEESYQNLAVHEKKTVEKIEQAHEKKVAALKANVDASKAANIKAKKKVEAATLLASEQEITFGKEDEELKMNGISAVKTLKAEFAAKVKAIIMKGPDK